ncbi:MAG: hypothetical protein HQM10_24020 [Candidatus Riflebacteria bacterium]|nr:hypothetical protein [Candidatus Riflebacteria bacterium]
MLQKNLSSLVLALAVMAVFSSDPVHSFPLSYKIWSIFTVSAAFYFMCRNGFFSFCISVLSIGILCHFYTYLINPSWLLAEIFHKASFIIITLFHLPIGHQTDALVIAGNAVVYDPSKTAAFAVLLLIFFRFSMTIAESGMRKAIVQLFFFLPPIIAFGSLRWVLAASMFNFLSIDLVEYAFILFNGPVAAISLLPIAFIPDLATGSSEDSDNPEKSEMSRMSEQSKKRFSSPFILWCLALVVVLIVQEIPLYQTKIKTNKILIDEFHSDWEPSIIEKHHNEDTVLAENNYYSFVKMLASKADVSIAADKSRKDFSNCPTSIRIMYPASGTVFSGLSEYDMLLIKCPTRDLGAKNIEIIRDYVHSGGNLWVIGDHTNVFMTGKHINSLLKPFEISIGWDSISNHYGHWPVTSGPMHSSAPFSPGRGTFSWASGASIDGSYNLIPLMVSAPNTFSDQWNPYNVNFFGNLSPTLKSKYGPFVLSAFKHFGKGKVFVHGDSTNFNASMISTPGKREYVFRLLSNLFLDSNWFICCLILQIAFAFLTLKVLGDLLVTEKNFFALLVLALYSFFPAGLLDFSFSSSRNRISDVVPQNSIMVDHSLKPLIGTNFGDQTMVTSPESLNKLLVQFQNNQNFLKMSFSPIKTVQTGFYKAILIPEPASHIDAADIENLRNYLVEGGNLVLFFRKSPTGNGRQLLLSLGLDEDAEETDDSDFPVISSPDAVCLLNDKYIPVTLHKRGSGKITVIEDWSNFNLTMIETSKFCELLSRHISCKK